MRVYVFQYIYIYISYTKSYSTYIQLYNIDYWNYLNFIRDSFFIQRALTDVNTPWPPPRVLTLTPLDLTRVWPIFSMCWPTLVCFGWVEARITILEGEIRFGILKFPKNNICLVLIFLTYRLFFDCQKHVFFGGGVTPYRRIGDPKTLRHVSKCPIYIFHTKNGPMAWKSREYLASEIML